MKITFPDGAVKEFEAGVSTADIAASISPGLKKKALAGKVNGTLVDLVTPILEDSKIENCDSGSRRRAANFAT